MSRKTKPKERTISCTRHLKHEWSPEDITRKGAELAEANRRVREIKEEAKRIASDYKAKTEEQASRITTLSNDITTGYTMRDTPCTVTFNKPKNGRKTVTRDDTKEVVAVEDMTPYEMQEILDFEEKEAAKKPDNPVLTDDEAAKLADKKAEAEEKEAKANE